jgi:hypothetical protein
MTIFSIKGVQMKIKTGRPKEGILPRTTNLSIAVSEYEKEVLRAIAADKGISMSALLLPVINAFTVSQMKVKELVSND